MNVNKLMPILKRYEKCPKCGSTIIGNGQGGIIIEDDTYTRTCKCGFYIKVNEEGKTIIDLDKTMKKFDECLETWNDLPGYVYIKEYRKAFKKFIQKKVDVGQSIDEFVVVMTLHHETDGRLPYFEFDRR